MLKTVIIGAGAISYPHAKAIHELGINIVGVLDFNVENAKKLAGQYGARVIQTLDEVLSEVDMVHLFTPPSKRVEYVRQAAEAGKHVFIEKPIAVSIKDAKEIIRLTEQYKVKLMVGFNMRFRKGYRLLLNAVKKGECGDIVGAFMHRMGTGLGYGGVAVGASWRTDPKLICGMSIESLSHDIDMLLHLVDGIDSVCANTYSSIAELPNYDNNATVSFRLKNGGTGSIYASNSSYIRYSMRGVIGTKGTAMIVGDDIYDFCKLIIKTQDMDKEMIMQIDDKYISAGNIFESDSYFTIEQEFMNCIEEGKTPLSTGADGLKALLFSHAILESNKTGKAIKVDI